MGVPHTRQVADLLKRSILERNQADGIEAWSVNTAHAINALVSGHVVEPIEPDPGDVNGQLRLSIYAGADGCTDIIEGPTRWIIGNLLRRFDSTGKLGIRKVKP